MWLSGFLLGGQVLIYGHGRSFSLRRVHHFLLNLSTWSPLHSRGCVLSLASRTRASPRQFFQSIYFISPTGCGHCNGWKYESNGMSLFSILTIHPFPPPPIISNGTNECNQKSSWNSAERMMLAFHCYSLDRHMGFAFSVLSSIWLFQCFVTWESQLFSGFVIYNSFVIYNNKFVIYKSVLLFFISF